jgi:uncharacterized protein
MASLRVAVFMLLALLAAQFAFADPNFPALTGRVVDAAGTLTAGEQAALEQKLADYETRSGHQVVVAVVPSLEGYDIRDYGVRLFRHWALGDKQRNDGVLLLVAPNERKVSIETGYGVEGDLTDAISRVIIENGITPRFKAGDFSGGLDAGVADIEKALGGDGRKIVDRARNSSGGELTLEDLIPLIILFLIVMFILTRVSRGGGRRSRVVILPMPGGSYGGGWSGGGGGFGGGGFSGGGGSSGGGGASGSW